MEKEVSDSQTHVEAAIASSEEIINTNTNEAVAASETNVANALADNSENITKAISGSEAKVKYNVTNTKDDVAALSSNITNLNAAVGDFEGCNTHLP